MILNKLKTLFIPVFSLLSFTGYAQVDLGVPNTVGKGGTATALVKDWEAIGINPANLGRTDNYRFSVTLINFGFLAQSKAMDFPTLKNAFLNPGEEFSPENKKLYSELFTTDDGLNLHNHINWLATSIFFKKFGGLSINFRDRTSAHASLNKNAADIIFNGNNSLPYKDSSIYKKQISEVLDGTAINFSRFREFNIAYGKRIIGIELGNNVKLLELYGGVGFKYIWGLANLDVKAENGQLTGQSAISNSYDINYGNIPNFTPADVDKLFNAPGQGTAWDVGATVILKQKLRVAVAVTDMGKITWRNNVVSASDTTMPKLDPSNTGINSWQLASQAKYLFRGFMRFTPGADYSSPLPARFRAGAGIRLGEKVELGADAIMPLNDANGNLEHAYMALGGELSIVRQLKLHAGFAGNSNYGYSVPLGISVLPSRLIELSVSTNDILTFFSKNANPMASAAVGVLRLNLPTNDAAAPPPSVK